MLFIPKHITHNHCTKSEVSHEGFLQYIWPNQQFPVDLVTFTEEILNGKLYILFREWSFYKTCKYEINLVKTLLDQFGKLLGGTFFWKNGNIFQFPEK